MATSFVTFASPWLCGSHQKINSIWLYLESKKFTGLRKKPTSRNRTARAAKKILCCWPRFTPIECRPKRRRNILFKLETDVRCYVVQMFTDDTDEMPYCGSQPYWFMSKANAPIVQLCHLSDACGTCSVWPYDGRCRLRRHIVNELPIHPLSHGRFYSIVELIQNIPFLVAIKMNARSFWCRFPLDVALTDQQRRSKIEWKMKNTVECCFSAVRFFVCKFIYLFIEFCGPYVSQFRLEWFGLPMHTICSARLFMNNGVTTVR